MVICVGGSSAGKTLLLSQLRDPEFDPDTQLVPTVGLNIFHVELGQQEGDKKKKKRKGDSDRSVDIRELGGQLAAVWADYIKTVTSVIFVINTRNQGQVALVGVKLCECLRVLEQTSEETNQVCRLCVVWTRASSLQDTLAISRVLRLPQLLHQTSVVTTQLAVDTDHPEPGLGELRTWLLSTL